MKTSVDSGFDGDDLIKELVEIEKAKKALSERELLAVRKARHRGHTWGEIGTLLGVSKQTVHRKYRGLD